MEFNTADSVGPGNNVRSQRSLGYPKLTVATGEGHKDKESTTTWGQAKTVVYKIPCKCMQQGGVCRGNLAVIWNKVRLTSEDIRYGRLDAAEERMGKEDGGLGRHSVDCRSGIDWG